MNGSSTGIVRVELEPPIPARVSAGPWLLFTLTTASIGAIVSVTIGGRMLKLASWGRGDLVFSWLFDGASWRHVLEPDRTWALNAVLFIPARCLLTLTIRRAWITIVSLSEFSILIEVVQRWTHLGVADVSDLVATSSARQPAQPSPWPCCATVVARSQRARG